MKNTLIAKVAVLAAAAWLAVPASAVPPKYYEASIVPTSGSAGSGPSLYSITIANCNGTNCAPGSSVAIGTAQITVPTGFVVDASTLSVSYPSGQPWTVSYASGVISLSEAAGNNKLVAGQSVTVSFNATAPCSDNTYQWTTAVSANVPFDSTESATWTLVGSQPTVTVTGSCSSSSGLSGYCSYTQGGWGADPHGTNPGELLSTNFGSAYPSGVQVGNGTNWMLFDSASAVDAYLPAGGTPSTITGQFTDPTSTSSGVFGGQVLTLRLNVDLGTVIPGGTHSIGDLILTGTGTSLDGQSVSAILADAESALAGGALPSGYTISTLSSLIDLLNNSVDGCVASDWANTHLLVPAC